MSPHQTPPDLAQAIVSAITNALIAVDASGTITTWNPAAEQMLGHAAEDAIRQALALVVPSPARPAHTDGSPIRIEMTIGLLTDAGAGARGAGAARPGTGERRSLASFAPKEAAS